MLRAERSSPRADSTWERLRYGVLLELGGRRATSAHAYASLVAAVEHRRHRRRRQVAEARIARWLGVSHGAARRIYRAALRSEALEEADARRFMRGDASPERDVVVEGVPRRDDRPRIYAALHLGSPVLGYLGLQAQIEPSLRVIARELDDDNPMPACKRAFARRKVAWVEVTAGTPFLDTDAAAVVHARAHLLAGGALYAAADVPGDAVSRAGRVELCGETVLLAAGIFRLAAMTGAAIQLVETRRRAAGIVVRCRTPVHARDAGMLARAVARDVEEVLRALPHEWWMWPFVA